MITMVYIRKRLDGSNELLDRLRTALDATWAFLQWSWGAALFRAFNSLCLACPGLTERASLWLHRQRALSLWRLHGCRRSVSFWAEVLTFRRRHPSATSPVCCSLSLSLHPLLLLHLQPPLFSLDFLCGGDGVLFGSSLGLSRGLVTPFEHLEWHTDSIKTAVVINGSDSRQRCLLL